MRTNQETADGDSRNSSPSLAIGYRDIVVTRVGRAMVITLDRPERRNALSTRLVDNVVKALRAAEEDASIRGVVLAGSATAFSAGADLNEALKADTVKKSMMYVRNLRRITAGIEELSKPVVAAIRGYCLTGGLEVALACDYRVGAHSSQFAVTSARIGSVAGLGGTQRLPRLIGKSAAKDLLFTGRRVMAQEALSIGLVDVLVEDDLAVDRALSWIEQCAEQAPLAVWMVKIAVNSGIDLDLCTGLTLESLLTTLAFTTEDRAEGMRAVLEKRAPRFGGI